MKKEYSYPIIIYEETGSSEPLWIGNFPGLNGCWVEGAERGEVVEKAPSVLRAYTDGCEATGWELPPAPSLIELRETAIGEVLLVRAE